MEAYLIEIVFGGLSLAIILVEYDMYKEQKRKYGENRK